jgi:hypothetical protein
VFHSGEAGVCCWWYFKLTFRHYSFRNILSGSENKLLFVRLNFVLFPGGMSQVLNERLYLKDERRFRKEQVR